MAKRNFGQNIVDVHQPFIKVKTGSNQEVTHYSIFYEGIPEEFRLVAEKELNETEETRRECLKKLKEALKGEFVEDALLVAFLRNKKFNVKKAEAKLRKFLVKWREFSKKLADMDMEEIENIIDDMGFGVLPYRDKHGRIIYYTQPDGMHLERRSMNEYAMQMLFLFMLLLKSPLSSITGFVYFCECEGEGASFYMYYEFIKSVKFYFSTIFALPLRLPGIEVLNAFPVAKWLYKIIQPVLSGKIIERITFHNKNYEELHKYFSPDILPYRFGGTMGPLNNDVYREKLLDFIKEIRKEYS